MQNLRPNWIVDSAGSAPRGDIDSNARAILQEIGLDAVGPAHDVREMPLQTYDLIVTLCSDEDVCPMLPAAVRDRVRHVPFEDPSRSFNASDKAENLDRYRLVRTQILEFCVELAAEFDDQS